MPVLPRVEVIGDAADAGQYQRGSVDAIYVAASPALGGVGAADVYEPIAAMSQHGYESIAAMSQRDGGQGILPPHVHTVALDVVVAAVAGHSHCLVGKASRPGPGLIPHQMRTISPGPVDYSVGRVETAAVMGLMREDNRNARTQLVDTDVVAFVRSQQYRSEGQPGRVKISEIGIHPDNRGITPAEEGDDYVPGLGERRLGAVLTCVAYSITSLRSIRGAHPRTYLPRRIS